MYICVYIYIHTHTQLNGFINPGRPSSSTWCVEMVTIKLRSLYISQSYNDMLFTIVCILDNMCRYTPIVLLSFLTHVTDIRLRDGMQVLDMLWTFGRCCARLSDVVHVSALLGEFHNISNERTCDDFGSRLVGGKAKGG